MTYPTPLNEAGTIVTEEDKAKAEYAFETSDTNIEKEEFIRLYTMGLRDARTHLGDDDDPYAMGYMEWVRGQ